MYCVFPGVYIFIDLLTNNVVHVFVYYASKFVLRIFIYVRSLFMCVRRRFASVFPYAGALYRTSRFPKVCKSE